MDFEIKSYIPRVGGMDEAINYFYIGIYRQFIGHFEKRFEWHVK